MAKRKKLTLSDFEKRIIKGIIKYTDLNDQEVTSIFSYRSRTINHREIGYFRNENIEKYNGGLAWCAFSLRGGREQHL